MKQEKKNAGRLRRQRPLLAAAAMLLGAQAGAAETARKTDVLLQPVVQEFPLIVLNVNVRDAESGAPVEGLKAADFIVAEDLDAVEIVSFEAVSAVAETPASADFVFVFDDTGSMSEEIEGLKQKTLEFANIVAGSGFKHRFALVSYKDSVNKVFDFTDSAETFKTRVSGLRADGGADEPENALDAIMTGIESLSHDGDAEKVFILITDASFHASDRVTARTTGEVIAALDKFGAVLHVVGPNLDEYRWMAANSSGTFYDKDSGQFRRIIEQIAGGSANNYRLVYRTERTELDNTWRAVEVALKDGSTGAGVSQYQAPSWVTASSRADGFAGINSRYEPHNAVDGNPATAWGEGMNGPGTGEWISLQFEKPQGVSAFALTLPPRSGASWPAQVSVVVDGDDKRYFDLKANEARQEFALGETLNVTRFTVQIEKAGSHNSGPSSIAEIELLDGSGAVIEPLKKAREYKLTEKLSIELNQKGEKLYHAKKYDEAIFYYKEAIKNNPTYAQAYSNLGLAYQRADNFAEAIRANRKAISLARGESRNTVIASSYYNIARIFEAQNKYEQALQNFLWAKSHREHSAYDSGIARMQEKLGL